MYVQGRFKWFVNNYLNVPKLTTCNIQMLSCVITKIDLGMCRYHKMGKIWGPFTETAQQHTTYYLNCKIGCWGNKSNITFNGAGTKTKILEQIFAALLFFWRSQFRPSGGIVGKNQSTQRKTTVRNIFIKNLNKSESTAQFNSLELYGTIISIFLVLSFQRSDPDPIKIDRSFQEK